MTSKSAPQHPGKILYDQVMAPLGVSRNKLARDIDVPVGRISDIVNGKRGVTPDTALRLARYFGTEAELWMRLQWEYDLYVARGTTWPSVAPRVRVFDPSELTVADDGQVVDEPEKTDELGAARPAEPVAADHMEAAGLDQDLEARPDAAPSTAEGMAAIALALETEMSRDEPVVEDPTGEDPAELTDAQILAIRDGGPSSAYAGSAPPAETDDGEDIASAAELKPEPDFGHVTEPDPGTARTPWLDVRPPEEPMPEDPPAEPLVLIDVLEPDAGQTEDIRTPPEAAPATPPEASQDEDMESLEIPDPDNLRYRVTTE